MSQSADTRDEAIAKLRKMIKGIQFAMLTTALPDGTLRSRPMATQETEFDGDLWFFCDAESAKVYEVRQDMHVNVSYADPGNSRYVSVSGLASITRDKARIKEIWTPANKAWFPSGPDDPHIALLKVDVTQAEYWDGPGSKVVQVIGFAKAVLTGHRYPPGENEKLDLHGGSKMQ